MRHTGWKDLADAVVNTAVEDLCAVYTALEADPRNKKAQKKLLRLKKFFYSDYFGILSDEDPTYVMKRVRKLCCGQTALCPDS